MRHVYYSMIALLACGAIGRAQAPPQENLPGPAQAEATSGGPKDDLDRLLEMDIEQLSRVGIINPFIEGVSKKEETLSESPGIAQVITAEEIRAFGAKNLYEVLNWATSVYTSGSYLYPDNAISIRGDLLTHNDNHRLVLINGRPFRDVLESGLNSSIYLAFPVDAIHHIEIIRGPGSVLYGSNAYTGVINVVTKKSDSLTGRGAVLAGSFGTQKYDVSQSNGNDKGGYMVATTYGRQEGWPFTVTGEGPPVQNSAVTGSTLRGYEDVGLFDILFSKPNTVTDVNPAAAVVNTPESAINLLSLDVRYDVSHWIGMCQGHKAEVQFLAQNLLDDDINHPEFNRQQINTLPAGGGRSFYGGFSLGYGIMHYC